MCVILINNIFLAYRCFFSILQITFLRTKTSRRCDAEGLWHDQSSCFYHCCYSRYGSSVNLLSIYPHIQSHFSFCFMVSFCFCNWKAKMYNHGVQKKTIFGATNHSIPKKNGELLPSYTPPLSIFSNNNYRPLIH